MALTLVVVLAACWRIGEPTESSALVTWAAYPETVVGGETFSFEFAGPVSPNSCGRLDTASIEITDSAIVISAVRSVYDTSCSRARVSFYEARPLQIGQVGSYPVLGSGGRALGRLVAIDSGRFSPMRAIGEGTTRRAGGCVLFGPGWAYNQRPFALRGSPPEIADLDDPNRVVFVSGRLAGYTLCGSFGSRPAISVDSGAVTDRTSGDYY
jgi:hypothetical protein